MIIASHTSISSNVEGTPPHQGFSLLISVEFACEVQSIIPEHSVLGKMAIHKNICVSPKSQIFSQSSNLNYELKIVHNCLDMAITNLMYHCKNINKFVLLLRKSAVAS